MLTSQALRLSMGVVFVLGMAEPSLAQGVFMDVSLTHPNAEAIYYVKVQGIVSGYNDGTYRPDQTINRAEFAKILEESIPDAPNGDGVGICPPNASDYRSFSDVDGDDWFWIHVCMQEGRGIIDGYPDGTFRPANQIKFVEAAKMLYGANHLDDRGILLSSNEGEPWFRPYVEFLEERYAIPTSITSFDKPLTRGEVAEMIYRLSLNPDLTRKQSLIYEQIEAGPGNASAWTMFIEESIGPLKYFFGGSTDYCGDIIRLKSSKCATHIATYNTEGFIEGGIYVHISEHENFEDNPRTAIADAFAKISLSPSTIDGSRAYIAYTYFGSYYYWLHDQKEIVVGIAMMCSPEFISSVERTRTFEGTKVSDEQILFVKTSCSALTDVASQYLKKYPSDL